MTTEPLHQRNSSLRHFLILSALRLAVLTGICFVSAFALFVIYPAQSLDWLALGAPPEPISEVVTAEGLYVYVQSASDKFYQCATYKMPYEENCWREVDELPTIPDYIAFDKDFTSGAWVRAPGKWISVTALWQKRFQRLLARLRES